MVARTPGKRLGMVSTVGLFIRRCQLTIKCNRLWLMLNMLSLRLSLRRKLHMQHPWLVLRPRWRMSCECGKNRASPC